MRRLTDALLRLSERPRPALAVIVVAQILLTLALAGSVHHNGWLFYQGGDQIWYSTSGWLLAHGQLPYAFVGYGWSLVLAPIMLLTGPTFLSALPVTVVINVLVLGPIVTLCVYRLAVSIGGRMLGLWAAALWVGLPYAAIPLFVQRYHDTYVDQVLPQALGLTEMADYPSMVAVLVAAVLVVRSLERRSWEDAVLGGLIAGFGAGMKPANYLFLAGPALAYLAARRWRLGASFALSLVPSGIALALWKQRGLGELPALTLDETRVALGHSLPVAGNYFQKLIPLDPHQLWKNGDWLREFFWSNRVVEWIPIAGALAVARRSLPLAGLLAGWIASYVLIKGSAPTASIERGDFWRLVMPAFPAFVLLFAAIPLLVPALHRRIGAGPVAMRALGRRPIVAAAVFLAAVPLLVTVVWRVSTGPGRIILLDSILVPVDGDIHVHTTREGAAQRLTWDVDAPGRVFYRVYRTKTPGPDVACAGTGGARCELTMELLTTTRTRSYVDGSPVPGVTYRVGVAANWIDDPEGGDVYAISKPVRADG